MVIILVQEKLSHIQGMDPIINEYRVDALNFGSVLNTANRLLYTMMSHYAAFGRIGH